MINCNTTTTQSSQKLSHHGESGGIAGGGRQLCWSAFKTAGQHTCLCYCIIRLIEYKSVFFPHNALRMEENASRYERECDQFGLQRRR